MDAIRSPLQNRPVAGVRPRRKSRWYLLAAGNAIGSPALFRKPVQGAFEPQLPGRGRQSASAQTIPSSRAFRTARVRSRTPSLERMLETWFFTVPSATRRELAISLLL